MLEIQKIFIQKGVTLSLAESCTGGLIASILTKTAGASNYFLGGVIAYTDEVKIDLLQVGKTLIEEKTSVDMDVAKQMCQGVLRLLKSDYAVAITGYVGPLGPFVGTVFGAIGSKREVFAGKIPNLTGLEREAMQMQCANYLLLQLAAFVKSGEVPFAHK